MTKVCVQGLMLAKGCAKSATSNALDKYNASATYARILSPENYSPAYLSVCDVAGKGHLSMQDYNWWTRTSTWFTYYIKPGSSSDPQGDGSFANPYVLYDGNEYSFNAFIRPNLDRGQNVECIFLDGTYTDVRLQIVKAGNNGNVVALTDPVASPTLDGNGLPVYTTPTKRGGSTFLANGNYTMGASATGKLVLRALNPGSAIFQAVKYRTHKNVPAEALRISGAYHQGASPDITFSLFDNWISGVVVTGLAFTGYNNGLMLGRARQVAVKNCTFSDLGSRDLTGTAVEDLAVGSTFPINDCELVLLKNNTFDTGWDTVRTDLATALSATDYPLLMHSVYQEYCCDMVYAGNTFKNNSGAILKFGYYAHFNGSNVIDQQYKYSAYGRRTFLIGNNCTQDKATFSAASDTISTTGVWAFVNENSVQKDANNLQSNPARGVVIAGNTFNKTAGASLDNKPFLRADLPDNTTTGRLPDWFIEGNGIGNTSVTLVLCGNVRGGGNANIFNMDTAGVVDHTLATDTLAQFEATAWTTASAASYAVARLQAELASPDASRDAFVVAMLSNLCIPGLDLP